MRNLKPLSTEKMVIAYQDESQTLTALDQIQAQISNAKELRVLEQQKKKAQDEADAAPKVLSASEAHRVRLEWSDTARTLERLLRTARRSHNTDEATERLLLRHLKEAEEEANQKYQEERKAAQQKKTQEPTQEKQSNAD